jgi:hypothetical protein
VQQNGMALEFVRYKTADIIEQALAQNPEASLFI